MRIIAGRYRGTHLATPKTQAVRPTSDRVRESVFNILTHGPAALAFEDMRVLDLFAGTGALGLEALSRGASFCVFVEQNVDARGLIRQNCERLGVLGVTKIFRRDATQLGSAGRMGQFDLVFADPPYGKGLGELALTEALAQGWLAPKAICVLEEIAQTARTPPEGFILLDERRYGETEIWILQAP